MQKKRLVIANWKMHPVTQGEARKLFKAVVKRVSRVRTARVVICPPTLYLGDLASSYGGSAIIFGAQDISTEEGEGSFTGEVSGTMLKRLGVEYAILGHSERRSLGETSSLVAKKVNSALNAGLVPVVCVGEHERDNDGGYLHWLEDEIKASLKGVSKSQTKKLIIAYEPIWAIGKSASDAMDNDELHQTALFIKKVLVKMYGRKSANNVRILYGGSVEPSNDDSLIKVKEIDGFLIGHASLDPDTFFDVVTNG